MHRSLTFLFVGLVMAGVLPAQLAKLKEEANAAFSAGDWKGAASAYEKVVAASPEDGSAWHRLGYALHAQGKLDAALKAHEKCASLGGQTASIGAYNAACVHALKGDSDKAFAWLAKARAKGFNNRGQLDGDTDMDSLRNDPRFKKFYESLGAAPVSAFVGLATRSESRVFFWDGTASPGQMIVNHGAVKWQDKYGAMADSDEMIGRRWRLGSNSWTSYESNIDVEIGGTKIPTGRYYLTLEKKADGNFYLAFLDPAKIRAQKLDAFQAHQTKGGIEVALHHRKTDESAESLQIAFSKSADDAGRGKLTIHFGNHALGAKYVTALARKKADH